MPTSAKLTTIKTDITTVLSGLSTLDADLIVAPTGDHARLRSEVKHIRSLMLELQNQALQVERQ